MSSGRVCSDLAVCMRRFHIAPVVMSSVACRVFVVKNDRAEAVNSAGTGDCLGGFSGFAIYSLCSAKRFI